MLRDIAYYVQLFLEAAVGAFGIRPYEEPRYAADSAPRPTDERVRIVQAPAETLAVLRFSGTVPQQQRERREDELLKGIKETPWQPVGKVALMSYDAPFTLPFVRRNEAAVRVESR